MIRFAEKQDLLYMIDMYMRGLHEMGECICDETKMLAKLIACMEVAPCFLLIKDDTIVGMAVMTIAVNPHNSGARLTDVMFYVYPKYRNIDNLSELVDSIKDFASLHNLSISLRFVCRGDEKGRKRLLRMNGFKVTAIEGSYGR